jgi:hypothetical protein
MFGVVNCSAIFYRLSRVIFASNYSTGVHRLWRAGYHSYLGRIGSNPGNR